MNYKVVRIGLLNFWYFDDEEFVFSDGKLLLRGSNGSGKSVTMQSFIPLILDGNRLPSRLDPFGSKEKKIEDYILGPSDGEQKSEAISYLYMETYDEKLYKYITIGIAFRARKGRPTEFWGFSLKDGKRIGIDFALYKDYGEKVLLTKNELRNRLGISNDFVETQKEYKTMVNDLLFGFQNMDSYDEFISVLLQLRSSKLSKEYTPIKLMDILSKVLQPLTEEDIRPLSETIENTNNYKEKQEKLTNDKKSLEYLLKSYRNYNENILYNKAVRYKNENDRLVDLKNNIKTKEKNSQQLVLRLEEIKTKLKQLNKENEEIIIKLETFDNKELEKYALDLSKIKVQKDEINLKVEKLKQRIDENINKENENSKKLKEIEDIIFKKSKIINSTCDDISSYATEIKMSINSIKIENLEQNENYFEYFNDELLKYEKKIKEIKEMLELKEQLETDLNRASEEREKLKKSIDEKETEERNTFKMLKNAINNFKDNINVLNNENTILKLDNDARINIFNFIDNYSSDNYIKAYNEYNSIFRYHEKELLETKNNLTFKLVEERQKNKELNSELEKLRNYNELKFDEDLSVLDNIGIPYVPLYKAIEFKKNISDEKRNKIENVLLNMGLLNSKIIYKEDIEKVKDIDMRFLIETTPKNNNLLEYFDIEESIIDQKVVQNILASISIDEKDSVYINTDKFKMDFMIGFGNNDYESKYIGILKRELEHKKMIQSKEKEIEESNSLINNYSTLIDNIKNKISTLNEELKLFPDNSALEKITKNSIKIEVCLEELRKQDKGIIDKITIINEKIKDVLNNINLKKGNIIIPLNLFSYKNVLNLISNLKNKIYDLKVEYNSYLNYKDRNNDILEKIEDIKIELETLNEDFYESGKILTSLEAKEKVINEVLNNPDNKKIIEEIKTLKIRQSAIPNERDNILIEKGKLEEHIKNILNDIELNKKELIKNELICSIYEKILTDEYKLGYIYQNETIDVKQILSDLSDKKNNNINDITKNYYDTLNKYHLELQEYRLKTKTIFNENESIIKTYVEKGLDYNELKIILDTATREKMSAVYQGKSVNIVSLLSYIESAIIECESYISEQERHLFEDILLKTVGSKIRDRIESSKEWVNKINEIMNKTGENSNLSFILEWKSKEAYTEDELDTKEIVRLLKIDAGQLKEEDSAKLINHFRSQIKKELSYNEGIHKSYMEIIGKVLDYRNWFDFKMYYRRKLNEKKELTNKVFFVFSGGERAKSMYIPLFAAVYAKLLSARSNALRLIALDEAFAGVDNNNIREMFEILSKLNLDYILTSQALWGDYDTVSSLSICELIKDEEHKAVAVRHYKWNGKTKEYLERSNINE